MGRGSVLCISLLEYVHIIITLIINAEGERGGEGGNEQKVVIFF